MQLKFFLVFFIFINRAFSQELPCLIQRDLADSDRDIVTRYLDQCSQSHITILNPTSSHLLYELLGKEDVEIKLSAMEGFYLKIQCHINNEEHQCSITAPILNFGPMLIGIGEYNPDFWMAKFHTQFFLRNGEYMFSPKQEYIVAKNTGAENFMTSFNQQVFNFDVLDNEGNSTVSITCEDTTGDRNAILCRIIF